jgi:hypothetical protein
MRIHPCSSVVKKSRMPGQAGHDICGKTVIPGEAQTRNFCHKAPAFAGVSKYL